MGEYAGKHLLDLLELGEDGRPGAESCKKHDGSEKLARPAELFSLNSFNSFGEVASEPQEEAPTLPVEIVQGLARLLLMGSPNDFPPPRWTKAVKQAIQFADDWAIKALGLGWTTEELFGLDPIAPYARHDARGLAFACADDECIVALTESSAIMRTANGSNLTFYRRPNRADVSLAWNLGPQNELSASTDR